MTDKDEFIKEPTTEQEQMVEKEIAKDPEPKETPKKTPVPKDDDLIVKANDAAERLENANKQLGELLQRQSLMRIEETLGGTTDAGKQEQTAEEKADERAKELLAGTGYEDLFDKPQKKT